LDDDVWDVRLHFEGPDNLERQIGELYITYMNQLSMIELKGYRITNSMYHVKEKRKGFAGLELIDGMGKVVQMVERCHEHKCISLIVVKGNNKPAPIMNTDYEDQLAISEIGDRCTFS
jgi:hypothetical protein